jgi:hypothetical protein
MPQYDDKGQLINAPPFEKIADYSYSKGKFDMTSRRIKIDKTNVFMFSEVMLIHLYKVFDEKDTSKVYIGTAMVPWKECFQKE